MVPKIIHQIWIQGQYPEKYEPFVQSWKEHNPNWEYKMWDEEMFFAEDPPEQILLIYSRLKVLAFKSDIIRFFLLQKYGGVYMDFDMMCLQPIENVIDQNCLTFAHMLPKTNLDLVKNITSKCVDIYFISSPQGHPFWQILFDNMTNSWSKKYFLSNYSFEYSPNITLYNDTFKQTNKLHKDSVKLAERDVFVRCMKTTDKTLAIHDAEGTWLEPCETNPNCKGLAFMAKHFRDTNNDVIILILLFIICVISTYLLQTVIYKCKKKKSVKFDNFIIQ
jgi:hypothetical protein